MGAGGREGAREGERAGGRREGGRGVEGGGGEGEGGLGVWCLSIRLVLVVPASLGGETAACGVCHSGCLLAVLVVA